MTMERALNGQHELRMSVREFAAWLGAVTAALAALSTWTVLPHRLDLSEKNLADHEVRIRTLERIDSQIAELRADIKTIKAQIIYPSKKTLNEQ